MDLDHIGSLVVCIKFMNLKENKIEKILFKLHFSFFWIINCVKVMINTKFWLNIYKISRARLKNSYMGCDIIPCFQ